LVIVFDFYIFQDLAGTAVSDRNWKGITIAIGVILLVLCGVAISVRVLTPPDSFGKGDRFSLGQILNTKYWPRRFNGTWISGK